MLQENQESLRQSLSEELLPNKSVIDELVSMGFNSSIVKQVLKQSMNNRDNALDLLSQWQQDGTMETLLNNAEAAARDMGAGTSQGAACSAVIQKVKKEAEEYDKTMEVKFGFFFINLHFSCLYL